MAQMRNTPVIVAALVGVALLGFGLLRGTDNSAQESSAGTIEQKSPGEEPRSLPSDAGVNMVAPAPRESRPEPAASPIGSRKTPSKAHIDVSIRHRSDGTPAAGASLELWRLETGSGASYRPTRRLTSLKADGSGAVSVEAPIELQLRISASAKGGGDRVARLIEPMAGGETRRVRMTVERPPAPFRFVVTKKSTGAAVPGAAIRTRTLEVRVRGREDFPGTSELVQRTNGEGHADLPGPVRRARWILVEAAGYSPRAIQPASFATETEVLVELVESASLSVIVTQPGGEAARGVEVQLGASLDGFETQFTASTNRRGEVTLKRLPAGVPCTITVTASDGAPALYDAVTLEPGEALELELRLRDGR